MYLIKCNKILQTLAISNQSKYGYYIGTNTADSQIKQRKSIIMAPRKKPVQSPVIALDVVALNDVLPIVINLLRVMSPSYPGYPTETLANKLLADNWDLNKHESLYLITAIKAVNDLAFNLRLNETSHLIKEVESKVQLAQAKASVQEPVTTVSNSKVSE